MKWQAMKLNTKCWESGRRSPRRRGVTLLFVLSLIVLFLLMGASFVLIANQFRRSATVLGRMQVRRDDARTLISRAFYDLLREPALDDANSPLRGHSLLGDMYGYGLSQGVSVSGTATDSLLRARLSQQAAGLWRVSIPVAEVNTFADLTRATEPLPDFDDHFNGGVFSLTDFYSTGVRLSQPTLSGLILDYSVIRDTSLPGNPVIRYEFDIKFGWSDESTLTSTFDRFDFRINARPFSGTGAGVFTVNAATDPARFLSPRLSNGALLPNRIGERRADYLQNYARLNSGNANSLATNEDYDAVDFQNMFLAALKPPYNNRLSVTPSFYRPELVKYHGGTNGADPTDSLGQSSKRFSFLADMRNTLGQPQYKDDNGDGLPDVSFDGRANQWDVDNDGDGLRDSIWMDIGLPTQTDMRGKVFKPLVAYLVVDMDGRLNVNAHGNEYARDPTSPLTNYAQTAPYGLFNSSGTDIVPKGYGFGPGEISLDYAFGYPARIRILNSRYQGIAVAPDAKPGVPNVVDPKATVTFAGFPSNTFGNAGLVNAGRFHSPLDIHGRFEVGTPAAPPVVVPIDPYGSVAGNVGIQIGLPVVNAISSGMTNEEIVDSVYEMDFTTAPFTPHSSGSVSFAASGSTYDNNFSPNELEAVLRRFDTGTNQMPKRLANLLQAELMADATRRHLLTTDSFETPVTSRSLGSELQSLAGTSLFNGTLSALPTEVLVGGRKMNVNSELDIANFPLHLFTLVRVVCPEPVNVDYNGDGTVDGLDRDDYLRDLAQWAVNVKDFRDADSINTRFQYGPNATDVVWGCERPELLLTESFAMHDKRLQDSASDNGDMSVITDNGGTDLDLDSRFVPNASAFFELYNPWVYTDNANTNNNTNVYPAELYGANGVQLDRAAPGGAPVWRVKVLSSLTTTNDDIDAQAIPENVYLLTKRIIYFRRPTDPNLTGLPTFDENIVFFPSAGVAVDEVRPGQRAVVGSAGTRVGNEFRTYVGRRTTDPTMSDPLQLADTRRIALDPTSGQVRVRYWDDSSSTFNDYVANNVVAIPIGRQFTAGGGVDRSLGFTDPRLGYEAELLATYPSYTLNPVPDGFEVYDPAIPGPVTLGEPIDKHWNSDNWDSVPNTADASAGLKDRGKLTSAYAVHLQRLADPTQPFDEMTNPYLTVDYIGADLSVFNGLYSGTDPDETPLGLDEDLRSFERGAFHNRLAGTDPSTTNRERLLWKGTQDASLNASEVVPQPGFMTPDSHFISMNVIQSFGQIDLAYRNVAFTKAFPWLTWNNRPYVSHLELANVPNVPQSQLTSRFDEVRAENPYQGNPVGATAAVFPPSSGRFNHLFGFHQDAVLAGDPAAAGLPSLHRIFDYLEVPSRFSGSDGRYPGKVNLNTIFDERVWNGLMKEYAAGSPYSQLSYSNFDASRRRPAGLDLPTEIPNVFRNAEYVSRVPELSQYTGNDRNALVNRTSTATLFRGDAAGSLTDPPPSVPLFELNTSPGDWADSDRSAYFRYDMRQRLGNLVTTRSSVFAVWITVGFFEIDPVTQQPINVEVGADEGTSQRYRGFFMVDRSIPVAFEPGQDHNVDRAVLCHSILDE